MEYEGSELKDTMVIRLIVDDRYRWIRHVILLTGILVMIFFTSWLTVYSGAYKYYRLLCICGAIIPMFYINMYLLIPRFFFKGKYIIYFFSLLLLVVIGYTSMSGLMRVYFTPAGVVTSKHDVGAYEATIILVPVILVTTMVKLFQRWTRDNERMAELRNITLTMELNELRNQINPHFLFNMLNGIKALVRSNPEKATAVIMKLSEFLRYQLYENNTEKALLKSEIKFLSNFLNLEMLRRDNFSISVNTKIDPLKLSSILLPPNLFTVFVENAVKHSVNIEGLASYIKVEITEATGMLCFTCTNSKDPDYILADKKNSGLGLANIKRRLQLLYGDSYSLDVNATKTEYNIKLTMPV